MKKAGLNRRLKYAVFLSFIGLLDQLSTWIAVQKGAVELNPLIRPFVSNFPLFIVFSIAKCAVMFGFAYLPSYTKTWEKIVYWIVALIFIQAVASNTVHALGLHLTTF